MSWKQYGGAKNLEMNRKITTNTVVADEIVLKSSYIGGFTIHGVLDVTGKGIIQGGLDVSGYVTTTDISASTIHTNRLYAYNDIFINGDIYANKDIQAQNNIIVHRDATILNNTHIGNILYLNKNDSQFIYSNNSGIGINTLSPTATLDISSNLIQSLYIHSSQPINRNIIAQNNIKRGVVVTAGPASSRIDFFTNSPITNFNSDGFIRCLSGGILELDVTNNTRIASKLSVTTRGDPTHPYNETVVIYDNATGVYKPEIYNNKRALTGDALSLIATGTESTSFLRIVTLDKNGIGIAGGSYASHTDRTMGMIGLFDVSGGFTHNQTIISGKDPVKYKTTVGINTYQPVQDTYALTINGPLYINNGDITKITVANFRIKKLAVSPRGNLVIAVGYSSNILDSYYGYVRYIISHDYGATWKEQLFKSSDDSHTYIFTNPTENKYDMNDIVIYDDNFVFITYYDTISSIPKLIYSFDSGYYWNITSFDNSISIGQSYNFNNIVIKDIFQPPLFTLYISETIDNIGSIYEVVLDISTNIASFLLPSSINNSTIHSFDYYRNNIFYVATNSSIYKYNDTTRGFIQATDISMTPFHDIRCINNNIIAVGDGIISVSTDGNTFVHSRYPNKIFTRIFIFDNYVFTLENNNIIWFSTDYGISFRPLWTDTFHNISHAGNHYLITDPSNNYSDIIMTDANTILLSSVQDPSSSTVINCFFPNLCNRENNHVLDICGNIRISGDIQVNDGGKLISNNSEFSLINENVNRVHFAENASTISIANISGNTTVNNNLIIQLDTTIHKNTSMYGIARVLNTADSYGIETGALIINGGLGISKTVNIGGNLNVNRDSVFTGKVDIISDTSLNGNFSVNSLTESDDYATGSVVVKGGVGVKGRVNILGKTKLSDTLYVISDTSINGILSVNSLTESTSVNTGAVVIAGGVGIKGNVNIQKNITIGGNIQMTNASSLAQLNTLKITSTINSVSDGSGALIVSGGVGISKNINIGGNITVNKESLFIGNVNIEKNLYTKGNLTVLNGIFSQSSISTNGNISIFSNTDSTDSSTGSLVVVGGVGISKNMNISGNVTISKYAEIRESLLVNNNTNSNSITTNFIHSNSTLNIATDQVSTVKLTVGEGNIRDGISIGRNTGVIHIGSNNNPAVNPFIRVGNPGNSSGYNPANIYIGGPNDIVNIQGSVITVGQAIFGSNVDNTKEITQIVQYSNNVILSYDNTSQNGEVAILPPSSTGAGLWINDFSVNNLGLFIVTNDGQGFVFKAPTYKSLASFTEDYNKEPSLPKQNILRFDVNKMVTTAPVGGLVILSNLYSSDPDLCRFSVTGTNIDISNVFTKNTDNTITGNLYSTATSNFNTVNITGKSNLSNLTIAMPNNANSTNSLDISGNISQINGGFIHQF